MEWSKKELRHLVVAILLLTFIFGFNDNSTSFNIINYLLNLLRVALAASIILLLFVFAEKTIAKGYGASAEFNVWWIQRFYIWPESTLPRKVNFFGKEIVWNHLYIGPILGIIVTLISFGKAFFAPVASMIVSSEKKYRANQSKPYILESELARIAASGLFAIIFLVVILSAIDRLRFLTFISMGMFFVGFHLIPLPRLPGGRLFFSSIPLYIMTVVTAVAAFALSTVLGGLATIILAVVVGFIAMSAYFFGKYY